MNIPDNIDELKALVRTLILKVSELEAENKDLRGRLNLNSQNSSKPPSSDGLKKKPKPAFPRQPKGKQGGQAKHQGDTLKMVANPDSVEVLRAEKCPCGHDLSGQSFKVLKRRQLFEIPQPKLNITEYQTTEVVCPKCGKVHVSEFPEGINAPTQYGLRARLLVSLLNTGCKLSVKSTSDLFLDLFGYKMNESTIVRANRRCYDKLEATAKAIQEEIIQSRTVHEEETGLRCEGKLRWLHVASTDLYTYLFVHNKRGKDALESEQSILKRFRGWLIHDCWVSYFGFKHVSHGICGAHLLRELEFLIEDKRQWAKEFKALLLRLYESALETNVENRTQIEQSYDEILRQADLEEPPPIKTGKRGRSKKSKGRNLLLRLQKFKPAVLAFAFHKEVPFTNNQAERDLRPVKVKQKISGCFRTISGAESYARIAGFISTLRKHHLNVFKELCHVFEGHSYFLHALAK